MKIKQSLCCAFIVCLALNSAAIAMEQDELNFDVELLLSSDDNINLSASSANAVDDTSTIAGFGLSQSRRLNRNTVISYFSKLEYQQFSDIENLDNASFNMGLKTRYKPVLGFTNPSYIASINIKIIDSKTDIRDSTEYNIDLIFSKRITTTLSSHFGINLKLRDSDSNVFDTKNTRIFANADLSLSKSSVIYTTYSFINGDSVSSLDINNASAKSLQVINLRDAQDIDLAFGNSFLAYRLQTSTHLLTLGFNKVIGKKQSLDFSIRIVQSNAGSNVDYQRIIANLSYLAQF